MVTRLFLIQRIDEELLEVFKLWRRDSGNLRYLQEFEFRAHDGESFDGFLQLRLLLERHPGMFKNIKILTVNEGTNNGFVSFIMFLRQNPRLLSNVETLDFARNGLNDEDIKTLMFFLAENIHRLPKLANLDIQSDNEIMWVDLLEGLSVRRPQLKINYKDFPADFFNS